MERGTKILTGLSRPRVLFLAHLLPYPPDDSAKIKSYYTLRTLAGAYDITLLAFIRSEDEKQHLSALEPFCAGGIQTVPIERTQTKNVTDAATALLSRRSFTVARDGVPAMQKAVLERLQRQRFDAVHIDHLQMAQYVLPRKTGARLILDHHHIESIVVKRQAEAATARLQRIYLNQEWPKLEKYEVGICKQCDQVLTATEEDAAILRGIDPTLNNVAAIPSGVDSVYFAPVDRRIDSKTLLAVGNMSWQPNIDAMLWFTERIYPMIKQQVSDARLNIVAEKPVEQIRGMALVDSSVTVTANVQDIRPSAIDCVALVVPLLSGSGMSVNILKAMSMALPIVSTRIGAEDVFATDGQNILIANSPENFSRYCIRLLREPALRTSLGQSARHLAESYYSWNAIGRRLLETYARVLTGPARTR